MTNRVLEKFKRMNVIDLYINQNYSLNQLQTIIGSDKRTIRDYLLANDIEVKGIKDPSVISDKNKFGLAKNEQRFAFNKFDILDTEEKAYWLGFWFADGCLCFTYKTHSISVLGTYNFLLKLKQYLPEMDNVNISLHKNKTFQLITSDKKAYKIANYLYQNATIYLDRKYEKYLDFCRAYQE